MCYFIIYFFVFIYETQFSHIKRIFFSHDIHQVILRGKRQISIDNGQRFAYLCGQTLTDHGSNIYEDDQCDDLYFNCNGC